MEVILKKELSKAPKFRFLHVCGGDPAFAETLLESTIVFSTYVEVILSYGNLGLWLWCFLHVCGGDPTDCICSSGVAVVFSTYVEVILDILHNFISVACFLHVCGGDP